MIYLHNAILAPILTDPDGECERWWAYPLLIKHWDIITLRMRNGYLEEYDPDSGYWDEFFPYNRLFTGPIPEPPTPDTSAAPPSA